MEIHIENFRKYTSKKIVFHKGATLIKGPSGVGKTTIFEAIKWCLHGNCRNIVPIEDAKKKELKTQVKLIFQKYTITRSRPPEHIEVCFDGDKTVLKNKDATEWIINEFGSKLLWECASYLSQGERNPLLSSNNSEKSDIIHELIFVGENDYETHKSKFETYLSNLNRDILKLEGACKTRKDIYNEENLNLNLNLKNHDEIYKKALKATKLFENEDKLRKGFEKFEKELLEIEQQSKINKTVDEMTEKLKVLDFKLKQFPFAITYTFIEKWKRYSQARDKISGLESANKMHQRINFSLEELISKKVLKTSNLELSRKYDLKESDILTELQTCRQTLEDFHFLKKNQKMKEEYDKTTENYCKLNKFLTDMEKLKPSIEKKFSSILRDLNMNPVDYSTEIYREIKNIIHNLTGLKTLTCPGCQKNLIFKENKLAVKTSNLTPEQLSSIEKNSDNIKTFYKNVSDATEKIKRLEYKMSLLGVPEKKDDVPEIDEYILKEKINDLSRYEPCQEDLEYINNGIKTIKINEEIDRQRIVEKENYLPQFETFEKPVDDLETYFDKYTSFSRKRESCLEFIEKYKKKDLGNKEKIEKTKSLVEKEIEKIDLYKDIIENHDRVKLLKTKFESTDNERKVLVQKRDTTYNMLKKFETMYYQNLENFVEDINVTLNTILEEIFEDVSVEISMFKKIKSKNLYKSQFTMNLFMGDVKYDNLNVLSGGEKDRLSMALALTISKIQNTKFLMLDECMSSLDSENRQKCLDIIKRYSDEKIILNICHETTEGYYDEIVQI